MKFNWYILNSDKRFQFAFKQGRANAPLIIAVHGSNRDVENMVAGLLPQAEASGASILAPLFAVDDAIPLSTDGYKFLRAGGVDYRLLLADMISQTGCTGSIYLYGFSGGAQFAHRFAYFTPVPLAGVIAVAPGAVTLVRDDLDWWPGLRGSSQIVGAPANLETLKSTPFRVAVGELDAAQGLMTRAPGTAFGAIHANIAGDTRVERAHALTQSLQSAGLCASCEILAGVGHSLKDATTFAALQLEGWMVDPQVNRPTNGREE